MGIMAIMAAMPQSELSAIPEFAGNSAADLRRDWPRDFERAGAEEVLAWAIATYGDSLAISTSFQREGMVILDMAARISPRVRAFTLDTGRLPDESYQMI